MGLPRFRLLVGVKLRAQVLLSLLTEGLLDKPAGLEALWADETPGLDPGFTGGGDEDLDGFQEAPPICTVSLMVPSLSSCSVVV